MVESKPLLLASASLIGVFVIGLVGEQMSLGFTDIKDIDSGYAGSVVHLRGVVKEFKEFSVGIKLLLEQDDYRIAVVYFTKDKIGKKNMCADVVGEVQNKAGSLEVDASSVYLFIC